MSDPIYEAVKNGTRWPVEGYLPDGTCFVGMSLIPQPPKKSHPEYDVLCPKCKGFGGWVLLINSFYKDNPDPLFGREHRDFRASCAQCNGWGWVKRGTEDEICVHQYEIPTIHELEIFGHPRLGMYDHARICRKCGKLIIYDSSD